MITLDMSSVDSGSDEIYSFERGSRGTVYLNGLELDRCFYANVTKGVAICVKTDLKGVPIIAEGDFVHQLVFGKISFAPAKPKDRGDWFDSCRPEDRD